MGNLFSKNGPASSKAKGGDPSHNVLPSDVPEPMLGFKTHDMEVLLSFPPRGRDPTLGLYVKIAASGNDSSADQDNDEKVPVESPVESLESTAFVSANESFRNYDPV